MYMKKHVSLPRYISRECATSLVADSAKKHLNEKIVPMSEITSLAYHCQTWFNNHIAYPTRCQETITVST